jgi:hypothetical protein
LNILRGFGIAVIALVVILASLFLCILSVCAFSSGLNRSEPFVSSDRVAFIIAAIVDLAVLVGGVYALKELNHRRDD